MKRSTLTVAATATLALSLAACGSSSSGTSTSGSGSAASSASTNALEVFSWWTSGSEDAALKTLISSYESAFPGVKVTNGAVAGGGGGNAQQVLATRIQGGTPPDIFQGHPAKSLDTYLDANALADLTSVYDKNGFRDVMPKEMIDAQTKDGKIYSISVGAHRGNVLWYSLPLLQKAGVTPPADGYTNEQFLADLAKVKASGSTALCLGGKDTFAVNQLFENTLLGTIGKDKWNQLTSGAVGWDDAGVKQAADTYSKIMTYADPDASALTWDQAAKKLGDGQCAFNSMGDWEYGELVKAGKAEGKDFGYAPHPGTTGNFVLVVDSFAIAAKAKDVKNAEDFAATLGKPEVQLAFNKIKGSTPIRTDVDVSSLPPYQQAAAKSYRSDALVWSITHGEATAPTFQQGFYDAVTQFVQSKDVGSFVSQLTSAVS